jgi:hypothetical protein
MTVEKITFDDVRNNQQKVLDFLDETFFTDSTVYMMPEEYIKKSVIDRMIQVVFMSEKIVTLDRDPVSLSRAMLRSSLREEDVDTILNASLRISGVTLSVDTVEDLKEKDAEAANKMIEEQKKSMASVDIMIGIIDDCLGTSRVVLDSSNEAKMAVFGALNASGSTAPEPVKDVLRIERPVLLDTSFIDLKTINNTQIFDIFSNLLSTDSNSTLEFYVPLECFITDVKTFLETDLEMIAEASWIHAQQLYSKSSMFVAERDAFASLFDTL